MTRRPFTPTTTAVVVQAAALMLIAVAVLGILIGDIRRQRTVAGNAEVPAAAPSAIAR